MRPKATCAPGHSSRPAPCVPRRARSAPVTGPISMAPAQCVRAGERDDLLVVEAHAIKDVADVLRRLLLAVVARVRAGQAAVGREALVLLGRRRLERVATTRPEANGGPAARLDSEHTGVHVQVGIRYVRVRALHRLEQRTRVLQAGVAAVFRLRLEAHRRAVRAARARLDVVRARAMPGEAHHHWRDRAAAAVARAVHPRVGGRLRLKELEQIVTQLVPVDGARRGGLAKRWRRVRAHADGKRRRRRGRRDRRCRAARDVASREGRPSGRKDARCEHVCGWPCTLSHWPFFVSHDGGSLLRLECFKSAHRVHFKSAHRVTTTWPSRRPQVDAWTSAHKERTY